VTGAFNGTLRPVNWGSSCAAWNDGDGKWPACVSESPPDWCTDAWCYIDTDACSVKHHPQPSIYGTDGDELAWSYDACNKDFGGNTWVGFPSPPPPAPPPGTAGCPCVDTSSLFTGYIRPRHWGDSCVAWDSVSGTSPDLTTAWGGVCFPALNNLTSAPNNLTSAVPDWCSDEWCYVDPTTCDVGSYPSALGTVQAAGLAWSYKTCNASFTGNSWVGDCECTGVTGVFNGTERPTNWGASCAAWNDGDGKWPQCVSETPPDWCTTKWCYVDTDACAVKHHLQPSIYGKPGSGNLTWSYDACDKNFAGNTYVGFPSPPPPAPPA